MSARVDGARNGLRNRKKAGDIMAWNELFTKENEPSDKQISEFIATPLWNDLNNHLQQTYNVQPKLFYSCCTMDKGFWKGWNIKYKKSGKALCTFYPKQGYFLALINIGAKEAVEADLLIPLCDKYTQDLYHRTVTGSIGKSLAIEVTSKSILNDVINLLALRVNS
ncbi:MAG: DUF3788 domain-containing protein [Lachnospiraceae bacterium]|nr:DUF3788 domain-containing protein [Lachnospiraceae bacterium]